MLEAILGMDTIISLVLVVVWLGAGYVLGRLALYSETRKLLKWAKIASILIIAGSILLIGKVVVTILYGIVGWWFVWDKLLVGMSIVILPGIAGVLLSRTRLRKITTRIEGEESITSFELRERATNALLVVPVQATGIGTLLSIYVVFFPLSSPYAEKAIVLWGLLAFSTLLLWLRQNSRQKGFSKGVATFPNVLTRSKRMLRFGIIMLLILFTGVAWIGISYQQSLLPDSFNMGHHHAVDYGGGTKVSHAADVLLPHSHHGYPDQSVEAVLQGNDPTILVTDLTGPNEGEPDRRFTLTAMEVEVQLSSGRIIKGWGFNGEAPGPELRVKQGDLVEVILKNELPNTNVTVHWHGINVPNAEDGVAGVTQDAVRPGESYTYRFIAEDAGTYWYHSHQQSSIHVKKGLYGAFIVEAAEQDPSQQAPTMDITLMSHIWYEGRERITTLGTSEQQEHKQIEQGKRVRLRLINTSDYLQGFTLSGTTFQVKAIDGVDVNEPDDLQDTQLFLAAGGRYVLEFVMPETPVMLSLDGEESKYPEIIFSGDGQGEAVPVQEVALFDPLTYGQPAEAPFTIDSNFDRHFFMYFDSIPGFFDGEFMYLWTINGKVFPHTPVQMVKEGELIRMTLVNRSFDHHPLHLHGHHMLVLSRNGKASTGSPWWTDTLNVAPGESFEVGFVADNPGIWMDHCHNLNHASTGMTMHLAYEGVVTPFEAGRATGNMPE